MARLRCADTFLGRLVLGGTPFEMSLLRMGNTSADRRCRKDLLDALRTICSLVAALLCEFSPGCVAVLPDAAWCLVM